MIRRLNSLKLPKRITTACAQVYRKLVSFVAPKRRAFLVVTLVVNLVLIAVVGVLLNAQHRRHLSEAAWDAGLKTAGPVTEQVLSYHASTLDKDLERAKQLSTGQFRDDFERLATAVVAPAARAHSVNTDAHAVAVSVVDSGPASVTALVFVDQTTTSSQSSVPRIDGSRVQVTLQKVANVWLIADLTPL